MAGKPAPKKGTKERKLYDRLWELCKQRRVETFTYKGPNRWIVKFVGCSQTEMSTQGVENSVR